ncbi:MAG TPA: hypothetical protein VH079_17450 [Terriglobales bacterium]|jgi:hypothetical protein|nr:hypothetical protein [Terriglobales bacterium]
MMGMIGTPITARMPASGLSPRSLKQSKLFPMRRAAGLNTCTTLGGLSSLDFPFSVVYLDDPDFVSIVAVAHSKRKPGY